MTVSNGLAPTGTLRRFLRPMLTVLLAFAYVVPSALAQGTDQTYQMPPQAIADLVDAPPTPYVSISPDKKYILLLKRPGLPSIDEVAQPELRLAGMRINPRNSGPSRARYYNGLTFAAVEDGDAVDVFAVPPESKISNVKWSPDSKLISFTITHARKIELWGAEVPGGMARRLFDMALNDVYGGPYWWASDSKTIIALTVPQDRGAPPAEPIVPTGPVIQENIGRKAPARTYQDLLQDSYDEALFEYYATAQPVRLSLDGDYMPLGRKGIVRQATPSPNSKLVLVETLHRPFSYTVPASRFPRLIEVLDMDGKTVHTVADLPLADNVPTAFGSVPTGPRSVSWRQDTDATLTWAEALDGGDAGADAEERDRVVMHKAPFKGEPVTLAILGLRYSNVSWSSKNLALVTEWWWKTRNVRTWVVKPGAPKTTPKLLMDYSWEDRYNDPGNPMTETTKRGTSLLVTDGKGKTIFLTGDGASDEGDRPFLDEMTIATGKTKRLFRSEAPFYERPVKIMDLKSRALLTRRESVTEPPNYYIRDLDNGDMKQLTRFPHPTPQLREVQKELIRYTRADGIELTATLYLPAGYSADDGPLPMLMWAYPQEFKSADAAGQVTDSPYRFVRVSAHSPLLWLVHGYAVLDDPAMPIIGEGDVESNDTYVEQLVASAQAAVDEVVRRGVADRDRIAIGGHSYGAFMAANLLAHSDLYRLGIARSGAYNRTLTPFGFQAEERTFWEAPEVYFAMSPFMHADKINEPILLIHGEADNNSGTFPIQSKRFYAALKGQGATVRLVMLPHESHGYRARESVMHMLYEMTDWMDRYVKNAGPREDGSASTNSAE